MFLPDFQVILLSSGFSPQLYPIAEESPKCLLPIANRPLISYQLELLERAGLTDIIIITDDFALPKLNTYLTEVHKKTFTFKIISFAEQLGTAEILSKITNEIRSDFIVVSGDLLIDDGFLFKMANTHRVSNAAVTLLLNHKESVKKNKGSVDYIGFENDTKRVVYYKPSSETEHIRFSKSFLHRYPDVTIYNNLFDVHFYILSKWVLDILPEAISHSRVPFTSIRRHLIPYLIRLQFTADKKSVAKEEDWHKQLINEMTSSVGPELPLCYGFVINSPEKASPKVFCARVDSTTAYLEINNEVARKGSTYLPSGQPVKQGFAAAGATLGCPIGVASVVGESTIGKDTTLKNAIIGNNCVVGERVKISNSVLMDNVVVKDGSQISDSVICNSVSILNDAVVRDSQLGAGYRVAARQSVVSQRELKNL
eukprot:TRINITY_DN6339_c0_g1_i1.p1 TRINITY_DN6339_c0_g1~~TRINITY_DN6339_c0_g1_i1.p1  ORF type:complete len:426 (+),score=80.29 TRINITY_DN6339_c0_g1_i1:44-1321(+)